MLDLSSFNNLQLDAIREVGNIGTGNAATALSKLLSCMIDMDVPKADLVSIYSLSEYYGDPDSTVAAVFVRSLGEFGCSLIFIQDEEDSALMVDLLLREQFGGSPPGDLQQEMLDSALSEVGNIILSSFLNAINMLIGTRHQISVPGVAHDMLASILDVVVSIFGQMGDMALVVNTELRIGGSEKDDRRISGNIVMLPDPNALELLLRKLQVL
ncbi:MAG: chemotaxis protein CheC [Synergistaceae bacterium]|jgi:chemotaxis protein CheC|nr:chemotaxis protein CheC [Synergistaceae bacterium]